MFTRLLYAMQGNRDQTGSGKRTSEVSPGELEGRKLLSKLSKFVADSDLSIYRIAQLMGVSGRTLKTWISGAAKPRRDKLLEIRSFLDLHGPQCLPGSDLCAQRDAQIGTLASAACACSLHSSLCHEPYYNDNLSEDQKNVNQTPGDVDNGGSQDPQYEQYDSNSLKHTV